MPTSHNHGPEPIPLGDPQPGQSEPNPEPVGDPQPGKPGPESNHRAHSTSWEISASKKVDDLSRHESKHDQDPKHAPKSLPKPNAREKTPDGNRHDAPRAPGGNPGHGDV